MLAQGRITASILDVGEHSPPATSHLVRRVVVWLLEAFGMVDTSAAWVGTQTGRLLSALALAGWRVARSRDRGR